MRQTTASEVHKWLAQLQGLRQKKTCPAPEFLRPFHFVTLALTLKTERAARIELPPSLSSYARRMRLWQSVGLTPPGPDPRESDASGKFVPIERLVSRDAVFECAANVAKITEHANLDARSHSSLDVSLSEIIDNCFSHAEVTDGLHGLACAQYWKNGNLAQVTVADTGIGIRKSFEAADTEDIRDRVRTENSCDMASQLGVTSKKFGDHAGYGLALTRQLLEKNGGTLIVHSGQEWLCSQAGVATSGKSGVNWEGTLVVIEFNTDKPMNAQDVYNSWPQVRGYSDDDFDF